MLCMYALHDYQHGTDKYPKTQLNNENQLLLSTGAVAAGNFTAPMDKNEQYDIFKTEDGKVRRAPTVFYL